jgi:uncharacterized phage-associated protein
MNLHPQLRVAFPALRSRRRTMTDAIARNSAAAVTNWFIDRNQTDQIDLNHLKIQKLLYFAQGWHLAFFDAPLFKDNIHAWRYGPVVETIYQVLKFTEKLKSITTYIPGFTFKGSSFWQGYAPKLQLDDDPMTFIKNFWDRYSKLEPWILVNSCHRKGTPWDQVTSSTGYDRYCNSLIPIELMRTYFKPLLPKKS